MSFELHENKYPLCLFNHKLHHIQAIEIYRLLAINKLGAGVGLEEECMLHYPAVQWRKSGQSFLLLTIVTLASSTHLLHHDVLLIYTMHTYITHLVFVLITLFLFNCTLLQLNLLLWLLIAVGLSGLSYCMLRGAGVLWGSVSMIPSSHCLKVSHKVLNVSWQSKRNTEWTVTIK